MRNDIEAYFNYIRYCINDDQVVSGSTQHVDWERLFLFMQRQALLGVGFHGIEKLKREGIEVPKHLLLKWYSISEKIRLKNELLNTRAVEIIHLLGDKEEIRSCILKGQGNATMYPNPFMRTSGDIDVWADGGRDSLMTLVRKYYPKTHLRYHHVDFPVFKDVMVEVHFMPSLMNNPIYNKRLNNWFENGKEQQFGHLVKLPNGESIPVPTIDFNVVYQLSHMMHHFFDEGIGLRQMMDYYFVLKQQNAKSIVDKNVLKSDLKHLGLYKFAGAVMYVMQEVFGLEEERMIVPVDVKRGKTLMDEILKGGNFGQYSGLTKHGTATKYFLKIKRNMQFVREYPAEALCEPVFRTWHFFWRVKHRK